MVQQSCLYVKQTFSYVDAATGSSITILQGTHLDAYDNSDVLSIIPSSYISNQCSPSPILAALFFSIYIVVVVLIMVDLITGIIIENLESFVKLEEMKTVTQFHVEDFVDKWEELDPLGSGFIHAEHFTALMDGVNPPMGVKKMDRGKALRVQAISYDTNIPLRELRFHFLETLHRLCSRVAHEDLPEQEDFALQGKMIRRLPRDEQEPKYTVGDFYTCAAVTCQIKGFLIRARLKPFWDALKAEVDDSVYEDVGDDDEEESLFARLRSKTSKKSSLSMTHQRQHRLASMTKVSSSGDSVGSVEGSPMSMTRDDRMALLEIASGQNRPLTAGRQRSRLAATTGGGAAVEPSAQNRRPLSALPSEATSSSHQPRESRVRSSAIKAHLNEGQSLATLTTMNLAAKSALAAKPVKSTESLPTANKRETQMSIGSVGPMSGPMFSISEIKAEGEDLNQHPFDPLPHDQRVPGGGGVGPGSSRPGTTSSGNSRSTLAPDAKPLSMAADVIYANPLAEDAEVLEGAPSLSAPSVNDLRQMMPSSSFNSSRKARTRMKGGDAHGDA